MMSLSECFSAAAGKYLEQIAYKQQEFVSHSFQGWEINNQT